MRLLRRVAFVLACPLALLSASAATLKIETPQGISFQLDATGGHYAVGASRQSWRYEGDLGSSAQDAAIKEGTDSLGAYQELDFSWNPGSPVQANVRVYYIRPVVLFTLTSVSAAAKLPAAFPDFSKFPAKLHPFSYKNTTFAPPSFALEKTGTPWLLYDDSGNAAILSPASNFMTASMMGDGTSRIACGLNEGAGPLPAGFTTTAIMTFGQGINDTWDRWGSAMTALGGKVRPANDADIGLRYLGYWTDNGATYYYNYDPALGYAGTLEKLVQHYKEEAIPIRYLQLDSWWYYKSLRGPKGESLKPKNPKLPEGEWNRYGGLLDYKAHPAVLPDGLGGFEKKVGLPLITHNRWIDPASPYHEHYKISGYAAIDPAFWNDLLGKISDDGVVCYEQDWLNVLYEGSPDLMRTPGLGEAFTDAMAKAAESRGMSLQYCMALPRYFLQGSHYANLTTIRTSGDRFKHARWVPFLYSSRLAGSLGIWPWTDVFNSTETENLLISILSAGMVGVGDAIGSESSAALSRVVRSDGVLIKPDLPLYPIDEMYYLDAYAGKAPMVASTHTDHAGQRTVYVLSFARTGNDTEAQFTPSSFGFTDQVMILNMTSQEAWRQPADERFIGTMGTDGVGYFIIVPIGPTGLAFFGDSKTFVTNGKKRIAAIDSIPDGVSVTVTFAANEKSVRLFGYSRRPPVVRSKSGSAGEAHFDPGTGRFAVEVYPSDAVTNETPGNDPVQSAQVEITAPLSVFK